MTESPSGGHCEVAAKCPREGKDALTSLMFIPIIDKTTVFGHVKLNKTCC